MGWFEMHTRKGNGMPSFEHTMRISLQQPNNLHENCAESSRHAYVAS